MSPTLVFYYVCIGCTGSNPRCVPCGGLIPVVTSFSFPLAILHSTNISVCVCVRACVRACVCVCVCACVHACDEPVYH